MYSLFHCKGGYAMSRFCPLFSSSGGNCSYVGTSEHGILVDAGCSCKSIVGALSDNGIDPESVKAVAITHEHSDHVKGLRVFLKKYKIPVISSAETLKALYAAQLITDDQKTIEISDTAIIDDIAVKRIATSHDCDGSSGFVFSMPDQRKIAVCTDLGYISDQVKKGLLGCDLVMLESNHDINMLKKGPYPFNLKERILSDKGHLSNTACAAFLPELVKSGTTRIVLAHLSRHNNLPTLALSASRAALVDAGLREELDYVLYVAPVCKGKLFTL